MAIGWLTALKAIPWSDVVAAAPVIVKGAKRLYDAAQARRTGTTTGTATDAPAGTPEQRLEAAEAEIATLKAEQAAAGEVLRSLAEQNARLVGAVERLRVRTRVLMWTCAGLAAGLVAAIVWLAAR